MFAIILIAFIPSLALACAWDYDTLKMERQRFPSALELITGKFLRHSPEFYEWRIRNREAKLASDPNNLAYLDDLAVAYDKIGKPEKAIEIMQRSFKIQPVRYETESNIALFYFHAGQLETSLKHVENALRINPDAHFGREKYQKYLTEYVISRRVDGNIKLPLAAVQIVKSNRRETPDTGRIETEAAFDKFLLKLQGENTFRRENSAAIKGILGMMRFANHESPVLLEAVGTLLSDGPGGYTLDGKRLSARAFLKASYQATDETVRRDYRQMATRVLDMQTVHPGTDELVKVDDLEVEFQKELKEARDWYADLHEKELDWIREGKNPEEEFDNLYDAEPEVTWAEEAWHISIHQQRIMLLVVGLVLIVVLLIAVLLAARGVIRRVRASRTVI
jgi:tetratricopeptide (TPR) repeat protein